MAEKKAADPVSYLNTFNPFSGFFGGGDKVPQWAYSIVPNDPDMSHLLFKSGACALLAAGIVGGARAIKHLNTVSEMADKDNPAGKLKSQISTTFEMPLKQTKKAWQNGDSGKSGGSSETPAYYHGTGEPGAGGHYQSTFSWANALGMALPVGATLLAATLAYKGVDSLVATRRNRILDDAIKGKGDAIKSLMQTRARIAKGNITEQELQEANAAVNNEDIYIKNASVDKKAGIFDGIKKFIDGFSTNETVHGQVAQSAWQTYGLLAASLLVLSAAGGYAYYSKADKNNIRFKALQKGLKEYAKNKAGLQPVTIVPEGAADYFGEIDGQEKPVTVRQEPTVDPDALNKPISVTL